MSKLLETEQESIPTLTDVVAKKSVPDNKKITRADKNKPEPIPKILATRSNLDRKQLEKLIYKKLHQNLPQMCQQLADEIIVELGLDSDPDPESTPSENDIT